MVFGVVPAVPMQDGLDPSSEGEDVAFARPSAQVLAFLREATSKSIRDVQRAWDSVQGNEEERTEACLAALLGDGAGGAAAGPAAPPQQQQHAKPVEAIDLDALPSSPARRNGVIDLDATPRAGPAQPAAGPSRRPPAKADGPMTDDGALAQLLAIFPGMKEDFAKETLVNPAWADKLIGERLMLAVDHLFSLDGNYPKADKASASAKGKRKRTAEEEEEELQKADEERYLRRPINEMADVEYQVACIEYLLEDFPSIPKPHITKIAKRQRWFYTPTYQALERDSNPRPGFHPFLPRKNPRKNKGKGAANADASIELERERAWFHARRDRGKAEQAAKQAQEYQDAQDEAAGNFIECGCCFGEYPFRKMVQCEEAHLFCQDCAKQHCETLLGERRCDLRCIDANGSGCQAAFPESELSRFLDERLLLLLSRVTQEKAIEQAGIDCLEKCRFCDFACVIDDPNEKLFECQNEECGRVFCRKCKEADHLPMSCEEAKKERAENSLHKVEEAMSEAFIRECPGCKQRFMKEDGCNKMTCSKCGTMSCFICRQKITGYEHFKDGQRYGAKTQGSQCPTFDDSAVRVHGEVEAARQAAAAEVQKINPDVPAAQLEALRNAAPPPAAQRAPVAAAAPVAQPPGQFALNGRFFNLPNIGAGQWLFGGMPNVALAQPGDPQVAAYAAQVQAQAQARLHAQAQAQANARAQAERLLAQQAARNQAAAANHRGR